MRQWIILFVRLAIHICVSYTTAVHKNIIFLRWLSVITARLQELIFSSHVFDSNKNKITFLLIVFLIKCTDAHLVLIWFDKS